MYRIAKLALVFVLLSPGLEARADLDGDFVTIEEHSPTLGNVRASQNVTVQAGTGDAVAFGTQNPTTIDLDPDLITLTLGCGFPVCNRISSVAEFSGFVLTGLDWSTPPGPPVDVRVESDDKFIDPARVLLLPGRIEINLIRDVFRDGDTVRIVPIYAPQVAIDVIPRSRANAVPAGGGRISVALLGSPELDVTEVDIFSLRFGPGEAPASRLPIWHFTQHDVNRDAHPDLVFHFSAQLAAIPPDASEACLTGEIGGLPFTACDAVQVRP